mgnify:CR=1 FL=1
MKTFNILSCLLAVVVMGFSACDKKEEPTTYGTMDLTFDNRVGEDEVQLVSDSDTAFVYTNAMGQVFNLTKLGYYISRVELKTTDGKVYADEVTTGPMDEDVKGFYHVQEDKINTQIVTIANVPSGQYNEVTFTLGVEAEYVQQGATGGVLDPANGGWLWNWDAGYIGWAMEGRSPSSPKAAGPNNADNSVKLHIGGWKDIAGNSMMVNNVKRITLTFPSSVEVADDLSPRAHIHMDVLKAIDGHHMMDFSTTNGVHNPAAGVDVAHNLEGAFEVHHVHQ